MKPDKKETPDASTMLKEHGETLIAIADALKPLDQAARRRVLRAAAELCGVECGRDDY